MKHIKAVIEIDFKLILDFNLNSKNEHIYDY